MEEEEGGVCFLVLEENVVRDGLEVVWERWEMCIWMYVSRWICSLWGVEEVCIICFYLCLFWFV